MGKERKISVDILRASVLLKVLERIMRRKSGPIDTGLLVLLPALSVIFSGPRHSLIHSILGTTSFFEAAKVQGTVAPGFENVKEAFEENVQTGMELGAQFVVYHKGVKVVDLWGGTLEDYDQDSLQVCFSCSKVLAAFVVAMAVDKGRLSYDEKVAHYWPEFAQNGKENITVADVLRHEAGLAYFESRMPLEIAEQHDQLADWLAKQPPIWAFHKTVDPGNRIYHGNTRGFILNELVRRTDPKRRTIGQIMREEIVPLLGPEATMVLGDLKPDERKRVKSLEFESLLHTVALFIRSYLDGSATSDANVRARDIVNKKSHLFSWFTSHKVHIKPEKKGDQFFNVDKFHDIEIPSVNMISNAKTLGKFADLMSRGKLLHDTTMDKALSEPSVKYDKGLAINTSFVKGGWCHFSGPEWKEFLHSFYGWGGFGGSAVAFDPVAQVGISYTMNGPLLSSIMGFRDPRCLKLMEETMKAIKTQPTPKL